MKKFKIVSLILLSSLLLFSVASIPTKAYVGVQTGNSYEYTISMGSGVQAFSEDTGMEMPGEEELGASQDIRITIETIILDTTVDSIPASVVNVTIGLAVPGYGYMDIPQQLQCVVFSNITAELFNTTLTYFLEGFLGLDISTLDPENLPEITPDMYGYIPFIIMAYNLNWTAMVEEIIAETGVDPNLQIEALAHGIKFTMPETYINSTLTIGEISIVLKYQSDGMLEQFAMYYEGQYLEGISLKSDDTEEIPGYELFVLLGTTGLASMGIVIYMKRKKK